MTGVFLYGTLCHPPLLEAVLGRAAHAVPAVLPGHAVLWARDQQHATIRTDPAAVATGVLVQGMAPAELERLQFYQNSRGLRREMVRVRTAGADGGPVEACVYLASGAAGAVWHLPDWVERWGDVTVGAARDLMAALGTPVAAAALQRRHMLLVRAASRLRAEAGAAAPLLRHDARPGDVEVGERRQPYARFFAVEEYDLRHRRFDGSMTGSLNRATFVSGDAAVVLPYDPVRDRVLLVEQFRPGPFARGDRNPWHLEPIAGRIDAGETPEQAARREAVEEAGITLRDLLPVANYYPSPGAKTEFLYTFVGLADLPDTVSGLFGLAEDNEDIRTHVISFARLMDLIEAGEVATAPLILSALWLAPRREALRRAAAE